MEMDDDSNIYVRELRGIVMRETMSRPTVDGDANEADSMEVAQDKRPETRRAWNISTGGRG